MTEPESYACFKSPVKLVKTKLLALVVFSAMAVTIALAQAPIIESFSRNGSLICTNLQPGTKATIEWAPSVLGPWTNSWKDLESVSVDTNGTIRVSVPMFYRVRGVALTNINVTPVTNQIPTNMVLIAAGSYLMGDSLNDGSNDERPVHTVNISSFCIDKAEVSKALWDEVVSWATNNGYSFSNPGLAKATNHPVHSVTWYDAVKWCNARSEMEGVIPAYYTDSTFTKTYRTSLSEPYVNWSTGYRLPTEAEWEKAARGGVSGKRFGWGDSATHDQANYYSTNTYTYDNSSTRGYHPTYYSGSVPYTSPCGSFATNSYGLFDMSGNVYEWCYDWYGSGVYSDSPATDPIGMSSGTYRSIRGGGWSALARFCRSAYRLGITPSSKYNYLGFRTVMSVSP